MGTPTLIHDGSGPGDSKISASHGRDSSFKANFSSTLLALILKTQVRVQRVLVKPHFEVTYFGYLCPLADIRNVGIELTDKVLLGIYDSLSEQHPTLL